MKKPFIIAGPCVIENEEVVHNIAEELVKIKHELDLDITFKASFDKANRTSINSYRGPGLEKGMDILKKVKEKYGLKIATDIHEPFQAELVSDVVDIIQIPAFLCRQTDLLVAAAKTGKTINVKKAQFLAPWDMKNVVNKLEESKCKEIYLTERGTSFGYNTLVVDMTSFIEMRKFGYPIVFDATHSVQKPGGKGDSTGGNSNYVKYLSRAAAAVGIDGLFLEVHPDPCVALSDGPNMVSLNQLRELLTNVLSVCAAIE